MAVEALSEPSGYEFGLEEPRDMGRACISIPATILSSFHLPYWRKRGPPRIERQDRAQEFSKVNEMIRNTQQRTNMSLDNTSHPGTHGTCNGPQDASSDTGGASSAEGAARAPSTGVTTMNHETLRTTAFAMPLTRRLNCAEQSPEFFKRLSDFSMALKNSAIEQKICDLVHIRASQINGCAFCLDMHVKEAKIHGESELRLYHVAIWRESNLFIPRERAALAWTEAVTKLPEGGIPDELYESVRGQLSEKEISDLTFSIMVINAWNRASIAFKIVPGSADKLYALDKAGLN